MIVGVPKETKVQEYRVALPPDKVEVLVRAGHTVLVENGAGEGSGFADQEYAKAGAKLVKDHAEVFGQAELLVKVKEPQKAEYDLLREGQVLFTYLHLAAYPETAHALLRKKVISVAYETVQLADGRLPLLIPMSEIAGRMAPQVGAYFLQRPNGGRGKLLGGVPGTPPCRVTVLGAGTAGTHAITIAVGMGAYVATLDRDVDRLRHIDEVFHGRVQTLMSSYGAIAESVTNADLVIGAVLVAGARAPRLATREMVSAMRPGSVIVDISVDQGGCIETTRPTSHAQPTYTVDGVIHYCVDNMPGAVPHTSSWALSNMTYPYALKLANLGVKKALQSDPALLKGLNTCKGLVTYQAVAEALKLDYVPPEEALANC